MHKPLCLVIHTRLSTQFLAQVNVCTRACCGHTCALGGSYLDGQWTHTAWAWACVLRVYACACLCVCVVCVCLHVCVRVCVCVCVWVTKHIIGGESPHCRPHRWVKQGQACRCAITLFFSYQYPKLKINNKCTRLVSQSSKDTHCFAVYIAFLWVPDASLQLTVSCCLQAYYATAHWTPALYWQEQAEVDQLVA